MFKALDLMEVIPPSAISQDGAAPTYVIDQAVLDSHRSDAEDAKEALQKPAPMPAAKLVEKKVCILSV
jgi:hypothetical protein